jgi:hypothetical protein
MVLVRQIGKMVNSYGNDIVAYQGVAWLMMTRGLDWLWVCLPPIILGYISCFWRCRHTQQYSIHWGTSSAASQIPRTDTWK